MASWKPKCDEQTKLRSSWLLTLDLMRDAISSTSRAEMISLAGITAISVKSEHRQHMRNVLKSGGGADKK